MNIAEFTRRKKIQRLASGAALWLIGSLVQGCAFWSAASWSSRSGEELFKDVVLSPIPEGISILHSQDEPSLMDPWVWLKFEVTPESLVQIEAAYDWMPTDDFERDESDALAGEWWQVDQLEGGYGYEAFLLEEECRCVKEMWVENEKQLVYFKVSF